MYIFEENDVLILSMAMIKFQHLFRHLSNNPNLQLDVIPTSSTIASACMNYFLMNFVAESDRRIAIVPEGG